MISKILKLILDEKLFRDGNIGTNDSRENILKKNEFLEITSMMNTSDNHISVEECRTFRPHTNLPNVPINNVSLFLTKNNYKKYSSLSHGKI